MKDNVILKLVDSSEKECEVTGRMMGGDDVYEIPVSQLIPGNGLLKWPQQGEPDHSIIIKEVGDDYVLLTVRTVSGTWYEYTLHIGEKASSGYCFGEWSYGYVISLEEAPEEKMKGFDPKTAFQDAVESEKKMRRADGKIDLNLYKGTKSLYERAAALGSEDAYAWLVKDALTYVKTYSGEALWTFSAYERDARALVEKAEAKGFWGKAREVYEARPDYYIEDGVLYDVLRKQRPMIVPDGVTTIAEYAFSRCNNSNDLAGGKVILPPSVTKIEIRAFMGNKLITEVEIQGPAVIEKYAFRNCPKLKKFIVNEGASFNEKDIFDEHAKVEIIRR